LVAVDFRKEGSLAKGPTLISYIEWEDFGHQWKIDTLEPSEWLPQGAEKAEVWRDENYALKAKISGTIEGSNIAIPHIDIHPEVEAGSLIPLFEIQGSDEYGFLDYEIGSCALGNVLSGGWRDQPSDPPIVAYEAELFTSGARWNSRQVSASEAEWLSEWYLNRPATAFHLRPRQRY
jgi:hypothetical protein